ncbi:MAG TPA: sigma-70 family RNA polymerase sigma factor [Bacteroidetes bacterium]|nr:sigma-70 family RNA polymerase sigma factor [Bacteroidota bacterium]
MNPQPTDTELLAAIKAGGQKMEHTMHRLLRDGSWQEGIGRYVRSKNGSREDAEDLFQEGLRHLIVNVRAGRFNEKSSLKTYLSSICKNLWHTKFSREVKLKEIKKQTAPATDNVPSPEHVFLINEKNKLLQAVLAHLGETCKQVLGLWSLGFSFKEISGKTGSSEGAVRKQKYDCLKKMTALLADRPDLVKELTS